MVNTKTFALFFTKYEVAEHAIATKTKIWATIYRVVNKSEYVLAKIKTFSPKQNFVLIITPFDGLSKEKRLIFQSFSFITNQV